MRRYQSRSPRIVHTLIQHCPLGVETPAVGLPASGCILRKCAVKVSHSLQRGLLDRSCPQTGAPTRVALDNDLATLSDQLIKNPAQITGPDPGTDRCGASDVGFR